MKNWKSNYRKSSRKVRIISLPVLSHQHTCRWAYDGSLNINSSRGYNVDELEKVKKENDQLKTKVQNLEETLKNLSNQ
jgi:hypothetical protein